MPQPIHPKRLLIVRNDRVGDLVLTLPAIEYARRAFPNTQITVLAAPRIAALLKYNPNIDRIEIDSGSEKPRELARRLRLGDYDAAVIVNSNTRNFLAIWMAGIAARVTWGRRPLGWLLGNRHVWLRRSHPPIHESEFALAFVKCLTSDATIQLSEPRLRLDPVIVQKIQAQILNELGTEGPLFGVHPGNYSSAFNWPERSYAELLQRLAAIGRVVVTGGPGEEALLERLRSSLPKPLQRRTAFHCEYDLVELCASLSLLDCLTVSNTGPMHLAGVLGTPLVALFSSQPAQGQKKWAPLGHNRVILEAELLPGGNSEISADQVDEHMSTITVDRVLQANFQLLTANRGRHTA